MSAEIGFRLKRAREARGLTVDEVADRIRIKKAYLTAIEQGRFDALPSPFYVRSYLRTYAHFLGMDASAILREYQREERMKEGEIPVRPFSRGGEERDRRRPRGRPVAGHRGRPATDAMMRGDHPISASSSPSFRRSSRPVKDEYRDGEAFSFGSRRSGAGFFDSTRPGGGEREFGVPYPSSPGNTSDAGGIPADSDPYQAIEERPPARPTDFPRRVSMPADLPAPQEIGLPPRPDEGSVPDSHSSASEAEAPADPVFAGLSRTRREKAEETEGSFGKWYNRFLIAGALLLIPAALFVGILILGEEDQPIDAGRQEEVPAGGESKKSSDQQKKPILYPAETSKTGPDHFELANVERIELRIEAEGECWVQLRGQEVGQKLKEVTLKPGDSPFTFEYGKDLWIELRPTKDVKLTVNGKHLGNYSKHKVVHIRLVK